MFTKVIMIQACMKKKTQDESYISYISEQNESLNILVKMYK